MRSSTAAPRESGATAPSEPGPAAPSEPAPSGPGTVALNERTPVQFGPIRQPRSHEYVAEQIRRHIDLRLIPPGWALPPERDLAQQFGVGRATVQLALRELELGHLVEVRRGRRGGTFVTHQTGDNLAFEGLIERILSQGQALEELLEYRSVLEPEVAQVAAQARSEDDLHVMADAIEGMKRRASEPEYMRHDSEFHLALAAATDNRFMVGAIDATRRQLGDLISLLPESDAWHTRNDQEHEAILRAVEERNPAAARGAMGLHVANADRSARAVLAAIRRRAGKAGSASGGAGDASARTGARRRRQGWASAGRAGRTDGDVGPGKRMTSARATRASSCGCSSSPTRTSTAAKASGFTAWTAAASSTLAPGGPAPPASVTESSP